MAITETDLTNCQRCNAPLDENAVLDSYWGVRVWCSQDCCVADAEDHDEELQTGGSVSAGDRSMAAWREKDALTRR